MMPRVQLVVLWLLVAAVPATSTPKAPPLRYAVAKGSSVEMTLRGYSAVGNTMGAVIISLPSLGSLYQLSQPYSDYGIEPKYEASGEILAGNLPMDVTDAKNRIVYVPPANTAEPNGVWASFHYKIQDSVSQVSQKGTVMLHAGSEVLVGSDFATDKDSWVVRDNGSSAPDLSYEASRQSLLNHFVHTTDNDIDISSGSSLSDVKRWKFCAPGKYFGNYEVAYGGKLEYDMGSFAGNYLDLNDDLDSVILECTSCNMNRGMRFVLRNVPFTGAATHFAHTLTEAGGWLKDPKNTLVAWSAPTACEMVEMLSSLSEFCITGDHTKWYESVGIDNVAIKAGAQGSVPIDCVCSNPGTQCTA